MQVRMLGQVEATDADGGALALGGPTQRRVLAALALRRNEVVSVPHLVDVVWNDDAMPVRAEHNIRTYVHRLRSALDGEGARVETVGTGYRLRLDDDELDAARFERLAGTAARLASNGDTVAAIDAIDEAERLWRGAPIEEFEYEEWAMPAVARLEALHATLRAQHAAVLLDAGRAADSVVVLECLVADEPLRERPRALLMRALYEAGRQAEALRAFQDFRRSLIDDIGVEPSSDLIELDRAIATGTLPVTGPVTRSVGGYELHERIGEGAFAVVHRASQASLGREVAVKIVRAELANRPEFIRRFEAEAQMIARIEHPNVVPLYDFWREPDRAYLVMRWMTGGSLETRLDEGRWSIDATTDLVDQIAAALDAAHRHGVVHRDVKPGNILFDVAGRAYLGDFGIALAADERSTPEAALSEGSPIYAAPEQLRREPVGPEADVHALAIVAFTLLTGRTPFAGAPDEPTLLDRQLHDPIPSISALRSEVPAGVDEVLAIATAKEPIARFPTASGFAAAFRTAATNRAASGDAPIALRPRTNPYKGLRAFDETDAADFHGRDRLVDELVGHLSRPDTRMLAVVGPSGSGKSSVVRAGLVPALRADAVPGSSQWFTTTLVPGVRPYEGLETALLRVAVNPPAALLDQLRDGDRGILRAVKRVVPDDDGAVTIVIDQFEELFTGGVAESERDQFLRALAVAAVEPASPVRFLITLRADFYDRPLRHPEFAPLLKAHTVVVTPLAPDELVHAIVTPAATVGVGFEPGLVAEIIADVNHEPGALPLLQYALTQAFDATDGDTITIEGYRSIGGLTGALGRRAEQLYRSAGSDEQGAARRVFGRLVSLGEGAEDTSRRARLTELGGDAATNAALEGFRSARLLTFDRDSDTREPTVAIAHEALIREWPRLREWLDDDRDGLRTHRHLTQTATAWIASRRDDGELYRGTRLDAATGWATGHDADLNPVEREFLDASVAAHEAELAAEQKRFDEQVRANRRLRALVAVAATVAMIAAVIGVFAFQQRSRADDQADEAIAQAAAAEAARAGAVEASDAADVERTRAEESATRAGQEADAARAAERRADLERLIAQARTASRADPSVGVLLALEAHRSEPSFETLSALHWALTARPGSAGSLESDPIGIISVLDDGERFVTHTAETLDVWNVVSRTRERSIPFPGTEGADAIQLRLDVTGDGATAATSTPTTTALVDLESEVVITTLEHDVPPTAIELSPDGRRLAIGFDDGRVEIHSVGPELPLEAQITVPATVSDLAWHPLGPSIAIGRYDAGITLWSPDEDLTLWEDSFLTSDCGTFENGTWGLLFSGDGRRLVFSTQTLPEPDCAGRPSGERAIVMVDSSSGAELIDRIPDPYARTGIAWRSSNEVAIVASASARGPVTVIDLGQSSDLRAEPQDVGELKTRIGLGLGVLHERGLVVVAGPSGIELRELDGSGPLTERIALAPAQLDRITRRTLLIGAFDGPDRFVTSTLGLGSQPHVAPIGGSDEPPIPLPAPADSPPVAIIDGRFGRYTYQATAAGHQIRDGVDGPARGPLIPYPDGDVRRVSSVQLNTAGDRLVVGMRPATDGRLLTAVMYDVTTGEVVAELETPEPFSNSIALNSQFTPDGTRVYLGTGFESAEFDGRSGEFRAMRIGAGGSVLTDDLFALRDGPTDPVARIVDADTLEPSGEPLVGHESGIEWIEPSPTRPLVATQGREQTARVWNLDLREQLGRPLPSEQNGTTLWSPDGTYLAVPEPSGYTIWNFDTETWADIACDFAGRNMTRKEWEQFGPRTVEYRPTCDAYPIEQ